jgi:hypothetical protein
MSVSKKQMIQETLAIIRQAFEAHAAILFMPEQKDEYILFCADHAPDSAFSANPATRIVAGKGLVGWIVRNRQAIIVNSFDQRSRLGYYDPSHESQIAAFMGCPLENGGVICIDSVNDAAFSEKDLSLLKTLAKLLDRQTPDQMEDRPDLAAYFNKLECIQGLRQQYPHWPAYLTEFIAHLAEATDFDHICFSSLPEKSDKFAVEAQSVPLLKSSSGNAFGESDNEQVLLPLAGSLVGWVARNEMPVHVDGLGDAPATPLYGKLRNVPVFQTTICLPVTVNKVCMAVLCLGKVEAVSIAPHLRIFIRMALAELEQYLEILSLTHKIASLLPRAQVHRKGASAYNPDSAPLPKKEEDDF